MGLGPLRGDFRRINADFVTSRDVYVIAYRMPPIAAASEATACLRMSLFKFEFEPLPTTGVGFPST